MKKVLAALGIVALVVLFYAGQIVYMGNLHEENYNKLASALSQPNSYFALKEKHFEKGFFDSKASFVLSSLEEPFDVRLSATLKNSIFIEDVVDGKIEVLGRDAEAQKAISEIFENSVLATFTLNTQLSSNLDLHLMLSDLDEVGFLPGSVIATRGLKLNVKFDSELKILGFELSLDDLEAKYNRAFESTNLRFKELSFKTDLDEGIDLKALGENWTGFGGSNSKLVAKRISFDDVSLEDITLTDRVKSFDEKQFDEHLVLGVKQLELSGDDFENLKLDVNIKYPKEFYAQGVDLMDIKGDFNVGLNELSIMKARQTLSARGKMIYNTDLSIDADFDVQSSQKLGEFLPSLAAFLPDEFFVQKEKGFFSNVKLKGNLLMPEIFINDKSIESFFAPSFEEQEELRGAPEAEGDVEIIMPEDALSGGADRGANSQNSGADVGQSTLNSAQDDLNSAQDNAVNQSAQDNQNSAQSAPNPQNPN